MVTKVLNYFGTHTRLSSGFLFAIGSAMLFAVRPIFVKLVYEEGVDPTTLIAFRMLFSVPFYIVLLAYFLRKKERRKNLNVTIILKIAGIGMLGYYAASFLDLLGLQYLTAQLARMILYCYPTFVVLLGAAFFGERVSPKIVLSLLITYFGIAVIFGHDLREFGSEVFTGGLYILGSALTFAFYLLFSKPLIDKIGSRLFTCLALISASIGILLQFYLTRDIAELSISFDALWLILFIAIFCTVIPTFFTTAAVARIGANKTGIISTTGPAFTSVSAVLVLNEAFTIFHLIGIALTVLGIWILQRK